MYYHSNEIYHKIIELSLSIQQFETIHQAWNATLIFLCDDRYALEQFTRQKNISNKTTINLGAWISIVFGYRRKNITEVNRLGKLQALNSAFKMYEQDCWINCLEQRCCDLAVLHLERADR